MSHKINYAKLHAGLFIPNAGGPGKSVNTKETLPPESSFFQNLDMTLTDTGGIVLSWDNEGKRKRFWVGASNVAGASLEPEELKVATPFKK